MKDILNGHNTYVYTHCSHLWFFSMARALNYLLECLAPSSPAWCSGWVTPLFGAVAGLFSGLSECWKMLTFLISKARHVSEVNGLAWGRELGSNLVDEVPAAMPKGCCLWWVLGSMSTSIFSSVAMAVVLRLEGVGMKPTPKVCGKIQTHKVDSDPSVFHSGSLQKSESTPFCNAKATSNGRLACLTW